MANFKKELEDFKKIMEDVNLNIIKLKDLNLDFYIN